MRLLVCGGRGYGDREAEFLALDQAHRKNPITLVIHGACVDPATGKLRGADRWAEEWALEREIPYIGFPAKWKSFSDSAGPRRNAQMLARMEPEGVIALPGDTGTQDMVDKATKAGIPVWRPYGAKLTESVVPAQSRAATARTEPAGVVQLLIWLEKGRTAEEVGRLGKDKAAAWSAALEAGWVVIGEDGSYARLSDTGVGELADRRLVA